MAQATQGDTVSVHYVGKLQNGAEFDSSRERGPMEVVIGAGRVLAPFETALVGMEVGDVKTFTIQPEEAYGPRQEALVHTVAREQMPADLDLRVGMNLQASDQNGQTVTLQLVDFDEDRAVLAANHPLAGQALTFEVELMAIAA